MMVAMAGVILRYKIAFPLPWVQQKHLLHAHSHFAFTGWISQMIMVIMITMLGNHLKRNLFPTFNRILVLNQLAAYGMLASFAIQGYGTVSISFSTLSILISYAFGWLIWKELKQTDSDETGFRYFKAAIVFNVVSSLGTFWLVTLMIEKNIHQNWYLAAVYFFLHFQYNGWFIFSMLGMLHLMLKKAGLPLRHEKQIYLILLYTLVPAYLLSTLWAPLPDWIYAMVVMTALLQLGAWTWLLMQLPRIKTALKTFRFAATWLVLISFLGLTLKFLLQAISTIPALGQFAFGVRPVVVAYLHLVMLVVVSFFLLAYNHQQDSIPRNKLALFSIGTFAVGVLLNEILLMLQGISFISPVTIGVTNEILFYVAVLMLTGATLVAISSFTKTPRRP